MVAVSCGCAKKEWGCDEYIGLATKAMECWKVILITYVTHANLCPSKAVLVLLMAPRMCFHDRYQSIPISSMFSAFPQTPQSSCPRKVLYARARNPCIPWLYSTGRPFLLDLPIPPQSSGPRTDLDPTVRIFTNFNLRQENCARSSHPLNINCGLAAPDVRLRISVKCR